MLDSDTVALNSNQLVRALDKPAAEFTKADIMAYIASNDIRMVNLRFLGGDGRLKMLNFVVQSKAQLDRVLTMGERVDGSSLFDFVPDDSSDLYVVPRFRTAFINPFAALPSIDLLCSFYDADGDPLAGAPEQILRKAESSLHAATGTQLQALGELEYYLFSPVEALYPVVEQRGYHEAPPFSKWGEVRLETIYHLAQMGCDLKYAHAEVGNFVAGGVQHVQQEIEFLPTPISEAADQVSLAKWVVRQVAYRHGLEVSFSPKIVVGQAGSGMHFHTRLMRGQTNMFSQGRGLSDEARMVIGGYLSHAAALTAFGNTVPTSFLRLVPHQEAPTSICWGDRNRSALVRVPLGWQQLDDRMYLDANPGEAAVGELPQDAQTIELRSPDGSANVHMLLAGMAVAAREGLTTPGMLDYAEQRYVSGNAAQTEGLDQLPSSCFESAERLLAQRASFEADGVFPPELIDGWAARLRKFGDRDLRTQLLEQKGLLDELVQRYFHIG